MRAKKLLATLLATSMVFGATMSVMAEAVTDADESGAFTSSASQDSVITCPEINITVPTTVSLELDPFNIAGEGQVVSDDQFITNESNVAISVGMGIYATKKTDECEIVFATAPLKGTETTKTAFIYSEIVKATGADTAGTYAEAYDSKSTAVFPLAYGTAEKYTKKANMLVMDKGSDTATYASYKFQGSLATKNVKAWADTDVVNVTVVFNFVPVLPTE